MLDRPKNSFKNSAAAALVIASTMFSFQVSANDEKCEPLKEVNGHVLSAGASALSHSEENRGTIAISTIPGSDVGNVPEILAGVFKRKGVNAECFVNHTAFEEGGTQFSFYVSGLLVKYDGKSEFGIIDLKNNNEILGTVADQARTAQLLASSNQDATIVLAKN